MFNIIQIPDLRWIPRLFLTYGASQLVGDAIQEREKIPSSEDIRDIVTDVLSKSRIPVYRTPYPRELHDLCIKECKLKRYPIEGKHSILKYLHFGVYITGTAYAHLDRTTQVFIACYTGLLFYIDDSFTEDVQGLDVFNERFLMGQKQANETLDAVCRHLLETHFHFSHVQANIILTSTLNFVTSTVLEVETKGMEVSRHAGSYATYLRVMTGICEAYSMFAFPPDVPIKTYIQAIPELCLIINYLNDVFSFYKEELAGEDNNYISNEANLRGEGKIPILSKLADDSSLCVLNVRKILEGSGAAQENFRNFIGGYASFHLSCERYQLVNDLLPP